MWNLLKGLNLVQWGLVLLVLVVTHASAYYAGRWNYRIEVAERATEVAEQRTETIIKEVEVRVPVVQERDTQTAQLRQEVKQISERLYEAINARPDNPACALSPDELRAFRELAERTRN